MGLEVVHLRVFTNFFIYKNIEGKMSRSKAEKTIYSNSDSENHILTIIKKRLAWYGISELKLKSISKNDCDSVSIRLIDEVLKKEFTTFFKLNVFEKDSYDGKASSLAA